MSVKGAGFRAGENWLEEQSGKIPLAPSLQMFMDARVLRHLTIIAADWDMQHTLPRESI